MVNIGAEEAKTAFERFGFQRVKGGPGQDHYNLVNERGQRVTLKRSDQNPKTLYKVIRAAGIPLVQWLEQGLRVRLDPTQRAEINEAEGIEETSTAISEVPLVRPDPRAPLEVQGDDAVLGFQSPGYEVVELPSPFVARRVQDGHILLDLERFFALTAEDRLRVLQKLLALTSDALPFDAEAPPPMVVSKPTMPAVAVPFTNGDAVRLQDGREGVVVGKGFSGLKVRLTKGKKPGEVGATVEIPEKQLRKKATTHIAAFDEVESIAIAPAAQAELAKLRISDDQLRALLDGEVRELEGGAFQGEISIDVNKPPVSLQVEYAIGGDELQIHHVKLAARRPEEQALQAMIFDLRRLVTEAGFDPDLTDLDQFEMAIDERNMAAARRAAAQLPTEARQLAARIIHAVEDGAFDIKPANIDYDILSYEHVVGEAIPSFIGATPDYQEKIDVGGTPYFVEAFGVHNMRGQVRTVDATGRLMVGVEWQREENSDGEVMPPVIWAGRGGSERDQRLVLKLGRAVADAYRKYVHPDIVVTGPFTPAGALFSRFFADAVFQSDGPWVADYFRSKQHAVRTAADKPYVPWATAEERRNEDKRPKKPIRKHLLPKLKPRYAPPAQSFIEKSQPPEKEDEWTQLPLPSVKDKDGSNYVRPVEAPDHIDHFLTLTEVNEAQSTPESLDTTNAPVRLQGPLFTRDENKVKHLADKLPGGKGDDKPDSEFDADELELGIEDEQEHTDDKGLAKEIAKDHLTKEPNYYSKHKARTIRPSPTQPGVYYHGTSMDKLPLILQQGLKAGTGAEFAPAVANDGALPPVPSVFLTTWFEQALRYAQGLSRDNDPAVVEVRLDPEMVAPDRMDDPANMRWPNKKNPFKPGNPMLKGQVPQTQVFYPGHIPPALITAVYTSSYHGTRHEVPGLGAETMEAFEAARNVYFQLKKLMEWGWRYPGVLGLEFEVKEQLGIHREELEEMGVDLSLIEQVLWDVEERAPEDDEDEFDDEASMTPELENDVHEAIQMLHHALFEKPGYVALENQETMQRMAPEEFLNAQSPRSGHARSAGQDLVTLVRQAIGARRGESLLSRSSPWADRLAAARAIPSWGVNRDPEMFERAARVVLMNPKTVEPQVASLVEKLGADSDPETLFPKVEALVMSYALHLLEQEYDAAARAAVEDQTLPSHARMVWQSAKKPQALEGSSEALRVAMESLGTRKDSPAPRTAAFRMPTLDFFTGASFKIKNGQRWRGFSGGKWVVTKRWTSKQTGLLTYQIEANKKDGSRAVLKVPEQELANDLAIGVLQPVGPGVFDRDEDDNETRIADWPRGWKFVVTSEARIPVVADQLFRGQDRHRGRVALHEGHRLEISDLIEGQYVVYVDDTWSTKPDPDAGAHFSVWYEEFDGWVANGYLQPFAHPNRWNDKDHEIDDVSGQASEVNSEVRGRADGIRGARMETNEPTYVKGWRDGYTRRKSLMRTLAGLDDAQLQSVARGEELRQFDLDFDLNQYDAEGRDAIFIVRQLARVEAAKRQAEGRYHVDTSGAPGGSSGVRQIYQAPEPEWQDLRLSPSQKTKVLPNRPPKGIIASLEDQLFEGDEGNCYENAAFHVAKRTSTMPPDAVVVHGYPTLAREPFAKYGHAWIEVGSNVIDGSTGRVVPKDEFYQLGKIDPRECARYTADEVRQHVKRTRHWGPWSATPKGVLFKDETTHQGWD